MKKLKEVIAEVKKISEARLPKSIDSSKEKFIRDQTKKTYIEGIIQDNEIPGILSDRVFKRLKGKVEDKDLSKAISIIIDDFIDKIRKLKF